MKRPPTILNVEDIAENRTLVRRILESEGYTVIDAVNALDGIDKAKTLHPDLILMDINLPDLDGFTAVTRIRSLTDLRSVPIIALTARSVSDDRARAKAIGCDSYINKPVNFDELTEAVAHYLERGHQEDDAPTQKEYFLQEHSAALSAKLEDQLTQLQTAFDHLKHLEGAKSSFISVASHELRTPLTVVHSYAQMLQSLPLINSDETAKELVAGMVKGVNRLQEIINDMVNVARVELSQLSFKLAPISLRSIMRSIETKQTPIAQNRNITLTIETHNNLPVINGDSSQIESAISRIVNNAIKYTPDGGQVTLSANLLENESDEEPSFVEIIVADTGVGIALDKQKIIFEKFSTASNVSLHSTSKTSFMGSGAGLGLPIAKGIIESHKGRIWVESDGYDPETLPGSRFFILLPVL